MGLSETIIDTSMQSFEIDIQQVQNVIEEWNEFSTVLMSVTNQ